MRVILTEVQARAIEIYKNNTRDNLDNIAKRKVNDDPFQFEYEPFNDMTLEDISKSVYIGYEVEQPKYEVGEWVAVSWINKPGVELFYKITKLLNEEVEIDSPIHGFNIAPLIILRHATKEEAFWAELGRVVNDFKVGDVIINDLGNAYLIVPDSTGLTNFSCYLNDVIRWLKEDRANGFYPAESFIRFPVGEDK